MATGSGLAWLAGSPPVSQLLLNRLIPSNSRRWLAIVLRYVLLALELLRLPRC